MKNRWSDRGAEEAVQRWGDALGKDFALRLYTARLIGADSELVLHGGGNVSLKGKHRTALGDEVDAIYVKASGKDLATLDARGLPALDLAYLRRLRSLDTLNDEAMTNELRTHLFDATAPSPSIETLVHAFLPHRFVDHSHADAVLAVTNHPNGDALAREAMGERVAVLPYVRPGFDLAKAVADSYEANPRIDGLVLLQHGLITFGDDARTSYRRHIELVEACERFLEQRTAGLESHDVQVTSAQARRSRIAAAGGSPKPAESVARVAPILRGLMAIRTNDDDRPYLRSVLEWRSDKALLRIVNSPKAKELATTGPLTGDHLIHTKPDAMFIEDPDWSHEDTLRGQLETAINDFASRYEAYIRDQGGCVEGIDSRPRVVLLPGAGLLAWGKSKGQACITADIAEHTLVTKAKASALGPYEPLSPQHLYDMEYRTIQRVKLGSDKERPLERHVVVISGGAGAIGSAVARVCAEAGAHVVIADLDEERIDQTVEGIVERHGVGTALGVIMDVTNEKSVADAYSSIVRAYGGVDVIVPNAGIAHVASIENLDVNEFRRVMEVNAVGYLLFMREGIRILKSQGLGGHIIIISSKNVFSPGKEFGAYSASKAAGHQLGKVAAKELAPYGIRVNMINADAVFGDREQPSGLWATVGPERARSRHIREEDLPEFYRSRNLLKARVHGYHVGRAVLFFASGATPTTGATLPVDGGIAEAFPR